MKGKINDIRMSTLGRESVSLDLKDTLIVFKLPVQNKINGITQNNNTGSFSELLITLSAIKLKGSQTTTDSSVGRLLVSQKPSP